MYKKVEQNKRVSIIIPVYNVESYLDRCIESILNQSISDYEILLIDDGSTDHSSQICDGYASENIRVIHKKNGGVSSARNTGLEHATGEYICFVDADDWLETVFLESMRDAITKYKADIVCCNYYLNAKNDGQKVGLIIKEKTLTRKEALDCYSDYYYTPVWGKLYSRSVLNNIRFDESIFYSEDTLFYTEAVMKSDSIYWLNQPYYHYFVNDKGALHTKNIQKWMTDLSARCRIVEMYMSYPELVSGAKCMAVLSAVSIRLLMSYNTYSGDNKEELLHVIKIWKRELFHNNHIPKKKKILCLIAENDVLLALYGRIKTLLYR